ncbi:substrate-binding periplasmic protein [Undibacterium sp. Ji49W]|uniref:substrate-binding periplasmic protein n=1 Tax=Undibacterium sp. Ji49W TaxID=3413040 RepID=UPI003BF1F79C
MHAVSFITAIRKRATGLLCAFALCLCAIPARAETITLIGEDNWYPYSAVKDGQNRGFAVDVIQAAYAVSNIQVKFIATPYSRCLMLVQSGKELGCFDSLQDAALAPNFVFHKEAIFKASIGIYAKTDGPHANASKLTGRDLRGHAVGVTHGYTYGSEFEGDTSIQREIAPSDSSNLRKLVLGRSNYSLVYTRVVDYLIATYPDEFKGKIQQVGTLIEDKLFVSFSKLRPESGRYADALDKGLRTIRSNGTYAGIEKKWANPLP